MVAVMSRPSTENKIFSPACTTGCAREQKKPPHAATVVTSETNKTIIFLIVGCYLHEQCFVACEANCALLRIDSCCKLWQDGQRSGLSCSSTQKLRLQRFDDDLYARLFVFLSVQVRQLPALVSTLTQYYDCLSACNMRLNATVVFRVDDAALRPLSTQLGTFDLYVNTSDAQSELLWCS